MVSWTVLPHPVPYKLRGRANARTRPMEGCMGSHYDLTQQLVKLGGVASSRMAPNG